MRPSLRRRLERAAPLLAFFTFGMGAYDGLTHGKPALGALQAGVALINLLPLWIADRHRRWAGLVIHVGDVLVALGCALSYYLAGTRGLHFAWLGAAGMFVLLAVVHWRRDGRGRVDSNPRADASGV